MLSRDNNFDLIRLFAALQVVIAHSFAHLELPQNINPSLILVYFPGVLIFFTVSGFLIFSSLDRSKKLKQYFFNRFLRLFPALWVCFLITTILLLCFRIINFSDFVDPEIIKWTLTQITVFQFWTPDLLRSWGVGTPNGSLWTIPVEIQFYILLPAIVMLAPRIKLHYKFVSLIVLSLAFNLLVGEEIESNETVWLKLVQVSIFPYLYCFLTGALIYLHWNTLKRFFEGRAIHWLGALILFSVFTGRAPSYYPDAIQIVSNFILSGLTIAFAYTRPKFGSVLKGNDISYGIYIYHMLVINSMITLGFVGKIGYLFWAIVLTILISTMSWLLVEERALRLKNKVKFY